MRSLARPAASTGPLKLSLLASAAIIATPAAAQNVSITTAVAAEEVSAAAASEEEAEGEVVVTGTRPIAESEAAALPSSRIPNSLVASPPPTRVGRLPDQNIAQAAGRLPGVAVERDQGQARYISLRGAPNYWTTLSFDGINVVSPEGRDARFDSIPSAIASQIIVSQGGDARHAGRDGGGQRQRHDALGVRLHRLPSRRQSRRRLCRARQSQANMKDRCVVSDRFDAGGGEIGVLVSGSYYQRDMITDNFETDWERVPQDQRPGGATRFWVARDREQALPPDPQELFGCRAGSTGSRTATTRSRCARSTRSSPTTRRATITSSISTTARATSSPTRAPARPTVNPTPTTSGYADVCIGNTPLTGHDLWHRHQPALDAARVPPVDLHQHAGGHARVRRRLDARLARQLHPLEGRSLGRRRGTWDSPSTRTLRPTVAYDFTDPNRSRAAACSPRPQLPARRGSRRARRSPRSTPSPSRCRR